jgi:hypothetical protein
VKLTYPSDFPEQLIAKIDVAIAREELTFIDINGQIQSPAGFHGYRSPLNQHTVEEALKRFIKKGTLIFAQETCLAASEQGWTPSQIERYIDEFYAEFLHRAYWDYHPNPSQRFNQDWHWDLKRELKTSDEWRTHLRQVVKAAARPTRTHQSLKHQLPKFPNRLVAEGANENTGGDKDPVARSGWP